MVEPTVKHAVEYRVGDNPRRAECCVYHHSDNHNDGRTTMSHFVAFVLTKDPSEESVSSILAPYDENLDTPPRRDYVELFNADGEPSWALQHAAKLDRVAQFCADRGITEEQFWSDHFADPENGFRRIPGSYQEAFDREKDSYGPLFSMTDPTPEELRYIAARLSDEHERYEVDEKGLFRWTTYNPNSKWDWWQLGGRWAGFFQIKADAESPSARGSDGVLGAKKSDEGVDIVRAGDVDWNATMDDAVKEAGERWDRVHSVADALPEVTEDQNPEAWSEWWNRPDVQRIQDAYLGVDEDWAKLFVTHDDLDLVFTMGRDEYVSYCGWSSCVPYAVVDENGWHSPGEMGWFGVSSDSVDDRISFQNEVRDLLLTLDPDTYIVVVDCHI